MLKRSNLGYPPVKETLLTVLYSLTVQPSCLSGKEANKQTNCQTI